MFESHFNCFMLLVAECVTYTKRGFSVEFEDNGFSFEFVVPTIIVHRNGKVVGTICAVTNQFLCFDNFHVRDDEVLGALIRFARALAQKVEDEEGIPDFRWFVDKTSKEIKKTLKIA